MTDEMLKTSQWAFIPGQPLKVPDDEVVSTQEMPKEYEGFRQVASTVKAYLDAAEELLNGKYSALKEIVPSHLSNPGVVFISCCDDGIIIRYDRKIEKRRIIIAFSSEGLSDLAPKISESVVYCYKDKSFTSSVPETGIELTGFMTDISTGQSNEIFKLKVSFNTVLKHPEDPLPKPPNKPYCLLSAQNTFEINFIGEMLDKNATIGEGQRFMTRSLMRLPVGWECIEIYPFYNPEYWNGYSA